MLIDLHVHTRHTADASIEPKEAIEAARELGLDGLAFADVDTVAARDEVLGLRPDAPVSLFFGVELTTDHGRLLCFFPDWESTPDPESLLGPRPEEGWPIREALRKVREAGAAAIASRPYDRDLARPMGDALFTLEGLSGVEALSGRLQDASNEFAISAASHLDLPCVGGSGAKKSEEIGRAATLFRDEIASQRSLVEALSAGHGWASWIGDPPDFPGDHIPRRGPGRRDRRGGPRRRRGGPRR